MVAFADFEQKTENGLRVVNALRDIKFGAAVGRNNASQIYKFMNALDVLLINAKRKRRKGVRSRILSF